MSMLTPNLLLQERYRVLRPVGRGGMGTVYEAIDQRLNATVALKEALLTDASSRRAFEREAHLLARLRHPVLPKVIDHFSEDERQFLVMEFISGDDLAALMEKRGGSFPPAAILPWVLRWADQLLDALDYLHKQTPPVIHRDIKPQNLKLTPRGDIILLDFGLARGGIADMATLSARAGAGFTPNYAPLEQIRGSPADPRSDLYSLGATLYHLATGVRPPDALTRVAALLNDQPDPLLPASYYNEHVSAEVNHTLYQVLTPNLDDRPASAAIMRRALYEARNGREPHIQTGRLSRSLPAQSYPGVNLANIPTGPLFQPPDSEPQHQAPATASLSLADYMSQTDPAAAPSQPAPSGTLLATWQVGSPVLALAANPQGEWVASGDEDGYVKLWQAEREHPQSTLLQARQPIQSLDFGSDGRLLAAGSEDGTLHVWPTIQQPGEVVRIEHTHSLEALAISPDGNWLAVGGWGETVSLYSIAQGELKLASELLTGFTHSLSFSRDSSLLAAGCYDTTIRLWDVQTRRSVNILRGHSNFVLSVVFHPQGHVLASGGGGKDILIWQMSDGRLLDTLRGHTNVVRGLAFSADGSVLASASEDKSVVLWRINDGSQLLTLDGHTQGVTSVAFSPDGRRLLSGSRDTKLRIWQI